MINVMIVDDENSIADLHSQFVSAQEGYRVVGLANCVRQAKAMQQMLEPDLILLDHYLPDGDGLALLSHWKDQPNQPHVVYISAANDMEVIRRALIFGVFDYLIKPMNYHRLGETLERFSAFYQVLSRQGEVAQSELDKMLSVREQPAATGGQQGVDPYTLEQVMNCFRHLNEEHSAQSLAEKAGLSKTTARRYLDHAVRKGLLTAYLQHGCVGRPVRTYHRVSGVVVSP